MLTSLANHYAFDIETPFEKLPQTMQEVVLNGSGKEQIPFNYLNERGTIFQRSHSFEGILHNLQRRYHESDSLAVREELSKYINSTTCPDCAGTRLKREARHVKVGNQNIHQVCEVPLKQALTFFESLELQGAKLAIADKIVKEIQNRLKFLTNVGLEYLSLSRSAETPVSYTHLIGSTIDAISVGIYRFRIGVKTSP